MADAISGVQPTRAAGQVQRPVATAPRADAGHHGTQVNQDTGSSVWSIVKDTASYMTTKDYWKDVGTVLKGEAKGVAGVVTGTIDAIAHPIDTAKGIGHAVAHPVDTAKGVWNAASKPFQEGDLEGMGEVVGATLATIAGPKAIKSAKGMVAGTRMTQAEIAAAKGVHMTSASAAEAIATQGLKPTQGLYKNLTTGGKPAVYMFDGQPNGAQKLANLAGDASKVEKAIEIDLSKLDPTKLYKRGLDGTITYRDPLGIPPEALKVR